MHCDNCHGPRHFGAPVDPIDKELVQEHNADGCTARWCRACIHEEVLS